MPARVTVLEALRRFLPGFLATGPALTPQQHRAIWALQSCRTKVLGGRCYGCRDCRRQHFAWHSCNHKACPQCGRAAIADWVQRELAKRVQAPYFLVTFTLPAQLRDLFFGPHAKEAFDLFFASTTGALSEKLVTAKGFKAVVHGFTAVLHTWNQHLGFHPHIHCLVPGAGLNRHGRWVRVPQPKYLVDLGLLQAAFRQHMRRRLEKQGWGVDPAVWGKEWGVHIKSVGDGAAAVKYLGAYVARTALGDSRMVGMTSETVSFRWKNRDAGNRWEIVTLPGEEFVRRYLRHVMPPGLRTIRHYGFCHPAARAKRLRVQMHSGAPVQLGATTLPARAPAPAPCCPKCRQPMLLIDIVPPLYRQRGPP